MAEQRAGPHIYTIPPHRAFADALAAGLIARAGSASLALARTTILLPHNRAERALTDAFVRRASGGGLLLPRMVAIGDPELDERLGALLDPADAYELVAPAVEPLERQLLLARLVQEAGMPVDAAEAMRLAADLARTLDQMIVEEIAPSRLRDVVMPELSQHWQASLDILETILDRWPRLLAARGLIDLAERRNRLLDRAAQHIGPNVIAAGITTSAPAVARLLRSIAMRDNGLVVIPGVDCEMPDEEWQSLGPSEERSIETHPQFHLKLLLDRMGVARGEVIRWRWGGRADAPATRSRGVANALAPAAFTDKWQTLDPVARRLGGVRAALFATPGEEAQAIAVAMREAIETPGRTAALVTPDRVLARRVMGHLQRWDIEADDSAGTPLSLSPAGTLLLALAECAAEDFAPVPLLALLKHPLVQAGEGRVEWLDGTRKLDRALRGPRPPAGIDGISAHLAGGQDREARIRSAGLPFWQQASALLLPFAAALSDGRELGNMIAALREAATLLAGDAAWARPDGRQSADLIAGLEALAAAAPRISRVETLPPLLRDLLDGVAVRPPQGGHPRIFIRGLLEARLTHEDLTILGGLNEGVWPAMPAPDPWLAPSIRRALGLPGLDRRIGLAAHDFVGALGAPQVLITRARRDARAPTIASRFLVRLEAMTGGIPRAPRLAGWARAIDHPRSYRPANQPAPCPPLADRPREIAVTRLDRLKADPFAFYAQVMLKLSAWDAVDADPTAAWRGTMVHAVFEAWMKEDGCDPAKLHDRAHALLNEIAAHPVMKTFWEPRLLAAIDWVAETMQANLASGRRPIVAELNGRAEIAGVELYGKVDRIDSLAEGGLAIVDYKTGKAPSRTQVKAGYALQLGLLGLIAEHGGFDEIKGAPQAFEYWSLAREKGEFGHVAKPTGNKDSQVTDEDFLAHTAFVLKEAVETWLTGNAPFTAKLVPEYSPYADYDQLMRLDEWYGRGDV